MRSDRNDKKTCVLKAVELMFTYIIVGISRKVLSEISYDFIQKFS